MLIRLLSSKIREVSMTLRHMKIFVAVYQEHSVTKAADRLHLAQPSVSLAVRELEDFYHVRLFDRISRHIYPTEIGHKFYDYALHIVSLFSEMENGIPSWENKAPIHIGSSITLGNRVLPSLVKSYRAAHPDIPVRVTIKNTETIEQYVLNNKVDFALVEGGTSHTEFTAEPFYSDRLCFIASPRHPLAALPDVPLEKIAEYDLLLREPGSAGREIADSLFLSKGISISPAWESVSTQALLRAAENLLGIAILPRLLVQEELSSGALAEIPVSDAELSRTFYLIRHRNKYLPPSAESFWELCRSWQPSQTY